jgi:hypothetical protein
MATNIAVCNHVVACLKTCEWIDGHVVI